MEQSNYTLSYFSIITHSQVIHKWPSILDWWWWGSTCWEWAMMQSSHLLMHWWAQGFLLQLFPPLPSEHHWHAPGRFCIDRKQAKDIIIKHVRWLPTIITIPYMIINDFIPTSFMYWLTTNTLNYLCGMWVEFTLVCLLVPHCTVYKHLLKAIGNFPKLFTL